MAAIEKRTTGRGEVTYRVKIRLRGHPTVSATFPRKTDARRWAAQTEAAIREGRYFHTAESQRHTLTELIDRYVREVLPSKRSGRDQARQLAWWRDQLGDRLLSDITPPLLAEYRDRLAGTSARTGRPRAPATIIRYMAALSHVFTVAVREWQWMDSNPLLKVTKPKEPRGRVRYLSDDEREALLAACRESLNPWLYTAVVVALSTGMRQSELMWLRWRDVDLDGGRIVLHETKNGERRAVPLTGPALALLREHSKARRTDADLLFPGRRKDRPIELRVPWMAALKRAGIEDFRWHDLRHSTASYLAMNGATLAEIAEVLGHKTLAMVKRYAHLSEAHTASVVERMNRRIFGGGHGQE